ncbi:MAG TPA: nitroreductase family deazaflavin-dependent oxidoreductase [Solirubrobacterales bacterium]|nr:nitroreductase family deazaflavin-dependent oxidoreductase [Solirubrobacterales bacterium]
MARVPDFDPATPRNPIQRASRWLAKTRFGGWIALNVANKVDPHLMRASRGLLKMPSGAPTVLLGHTGAKSGAKRTTPLLYFTDGANVILIASQTGKARHPAWFHNVRANPEVELWSGGRGGAYRAHEAPEPERSRLWALATQLYPGYDDYQSRADAAGRRIPVVVCEPLDA